MGVQLLVCFWLILVQDINCSEMVLKLKVVVAEAPATNPLVAGMCRSSQPIE